MPLKILSHLNSKRLAQIEGLRRECSALDGTEYRFYTGDADARDFFALYYEGKRLTGFAFCCCGEPAEISGAIHPDFRGRHIFARMVSALKNHAKAGTYEFSGRDAYPGFIECAKSLGAVCRREEHLMRFTAKEPPACPLLQYSERENGNVFLFGEPERPSGHISLSYDGALVNIYNVYVEPRLRGQGLGYSMMCSVLDRLATENMKNIVLQVSGSNKPALALYAKCGFEITDSVVFYSSGAIQDSYSP